jgi:hypothetical protein
MLDIAQAHHPVGQQFQREAVPPIGSLATREMDQLGFSLAIQAAPFGPFAREASGESYFQVLLRHPRCLIRITVRRLMESTSAMCPSVWLGPP